MIFQKRYYWKSMVGAVLFGLLSDPVFAANRAYWIAADEVAWDYAQGEWVRCYILEMGTEVDLHSLHWHRAILLHNGNRLNIAKVLPAATKNT